VQSVEKRGGWPRSLMCAAVKHRPASLAPGWVTTEVFSVIQTCSSKPTVTPHKMIMAKINKINNNKKKQCIKMVIRSLQCIDT